MPNLTIYKASAGSGKTYKITEEFIRLLFKYPFNYKHTLAVTFTNKATAEMKSRIISEIYYLAYGLNSAYESFIKIEFGISETEIQEKAKLILHNILHDFSRFSIETIDRFFQKIMQSFTREIGLQLGYNLELDNKKVLRKVIDQLWLELDDNLQLKNWMLQYTIWNMEEGRTWNLKNDLFYLGEQVFKEKFQQFNSVLIKKLTSKDFLNNYFEKLNKIIHKFESTLSELGKKGLEIIENYSLEPGDFNYGKSSVANYFLKISKKTDFDPMKRPVKVLNGEENWYSQKSEFKNEIITAVENGLHDTLAKAVYYYNENHKIYNTAKELSKSFFALGLLTDLSKKIREYAYNENLFLLADVGKLLFEVVNNNPAPFIYEKTGSYLRNYMIDEFQDTSEIQWNNFKPLIEDSLSQNNKTVLVGDVKQSIYRWRNSEWKILATEVENAFQQFNPDIKNLDFNWRSKQNIIQFNNALFSLASIHLQNFFDEENEPDNHNFNNIIQKAYNDVIQKIPENTGEGGMVYAGFLQSEEDKPWKEKALEKIPLIFKRLNNQGLNAKDIAILVRQNNEGKEIADYLLKCNDLPYSIISDEALYISSSICVKLILSCLKILLNNHDQISKYSIIHYYQLYIKNRNIDKFNFEKELPDDLFTRIFKLKSLPLFETVDHIIRDFNLHTVNGQTPYIIAFQDLVHDYTSKNSSDINQFLNWWDEEGALKAITFNNNLDAVRILTIHKSKGLQFKAVLIPFCNWAIDYSYTNRNVLWCQPKIEPFCQLDLVPLFYNQNLRKTIFTNDYYNEKLSAYIDNLNLLYVSFTRAKEILIVFGETNNNKKIKNVSDLIIKTFEDKECNFTVNNMLDLESFFNSYNSEKYEYLIGELEKEDELNDEITIKEIAVNKPLNSYQNRLLLKYNGIDYFIEQGIDLKEKLNYGKLMHEAFEKIKTIEDIEKAVNSLIQTGKINSEQGQYFQSRIKKAFNNEKVKNWFKKDLELKTEVSVLLTDGTMLRPDRVIINDKNAIVIDYKFGSEVNEIHKKQVKNYMNYLGLMGFAKIDGFLWYVDLNQIVDI